MILEKIKKDMMSAKIQKDSVKAGLLSTLAGEISNSSKSISNFDEESEIKIIRKFIKNIDETLKLDITEEKKAQLNTEKVILGSYLPAEMTEEEIRAIIDNVISRSTNQLTKYKAGETKLFGYFVGNTMKDSKGRANPKIVNDVLLEKLR